MSSAADRVNPYPGLRPFEERDKDAFYGCEAQVHKLFELVTQHRFVTVSGLSGCGKSSLVRAGLIPYLKETSPSREWIVIKMRPGGDPLENLATALVRAAVQNSSKIAESHVRTEVAALSTRLEDSPASLSDFVSSEFSLNAADVFILVDQFEEIVRFDEPGSNSREDKRNESKGNARKLGRERSQFLVDALLRATNNSHENSMHVLVTLRSDYLGHMSVFPNLCAAIDRAHFLTPRLEPDEYRGAILGPRKKHSSDIDFAFQIETSVVNRCIADIAGVREPLPLLQHAFMRMWDSAAARSETIHIKTEDYKRIGNVRNALSRHADEVLESLEVDQRTVEVLFRTLVEGSGERARRRPTTLGTLARIADVDLDEMRKVVECFQADGRSFLTAPTEEKLDGDTVIDLTHESLAREWKTLSDKWIPKEQESDRIYARLRQTAADCLRRA